MFDNKDYCKFTHGLMVCAIVTGYHSVFEYSKKLGITWVNIASLRWGGAHKSPPLTPDPMILFFTIVLFVLAQAITLQRCFNRIEDGEISFKEGIKDWLIALAEYIIAFIAVLIFLPLFYRFLRGW